MIDVLVLGGGISGLSVAHGLAQRGLKVRLVEASDSFGGVLQSKREEGFLFERGPNTVLATSEAVTRLVDAVGLGDRIQWADDTAAKRYIARRGRLYAVPSGLGSGIMTRLFTMRAKFRLLREPWIKPSPPEANETVAEFVSRRLGPDFLNYAINPMVAGVYAGNPEELEIRSVFPKIYALEEQYGSLIRGMIGGAKERKAREAAGDVARDRARLFSFPDGLQELPLAAARGLGENAATNVRAVSVSAEEGGWRVATEARDGTREEISARAVIPAMDTAGLVKLFPGSELDSLAEVPHPPVAIVGMGWKDEPGGMTRDGFGYLLPAKEPFSSLGTLWSSTLFPGRAPNGGAVLTTFVGGRRAPELVALEDEALIGRVRDDLRTLMGIESAPDHVTIERYEAAIPQYTIGHRLRVEAAGRFEETHPGVFLAVNALQGVSVGDRIRVGSEIAERVAAYLDPAMKDERE